MALSIKTEEADRLARQLAGLTGETMTEAITKALRERIDRLLSEQKQDGSATAETLLKLAEDIRARHDLRPVSKEEWDALWGDEAR